MKFIDWVKKNYQYKWFMSIFTGSDELPWDYFLDYFNGDVETATRVYRKYYGMTDKSVHYYEKK